MDTSRVSNWVDFVVSELTHNELEYFEKMLQQIIKEKNRVFLEEPLTANPKKFKGIKIEDAELTIRSTRILISRKYKTLDQVAKLSRSQLIALSKYGFMRKSMTEIIDLLPFIFSPSSLWVLILVFELAYPNHLTARLHRR